MSGTPTLYCDGASRGNPGKGAAGFVLLQENPDSSGCVRSTGGALLSGSVTNNQAEYTALILGLNEAILRGLSHLNVFMDSKLVVEQVNGRWKVKNITLRTFHACVEKALQAFKEVEISWVSREKNKDADRVANEFLDGVRT